MPPPFDKERLRYQDFIVQPATFWTRSLWKMAGELNESFNLTFDWEWFIRASTICDFIPIEYYFSIFRFHELHITSNAGIKRSKQILEIVEKYADKKWVSAYKDVYTRLKFSLNSRNRLKKMRLYNLRFLLYPGLLIKHGEDRITTALHSLYTGGLIDSKSLEKIGSKKN